MSQARLHAIADIHLAAQPRAADDLCTFYGAVVGLELVESDEHPGHLCFQTEQLQIRFELDNSAAAQPAARRATIIVPSLEQLRRQLDDFQIRYEDYRGLDFSEQRVYVTDPAGHRIEFKQVWPF